MHVDDDKPETDDPLYQPGEGSLVRQLGAEDGRVRACGDLAFVELCSQRSARLAAESDLICMWSHWDYASESVVDTGRQGARRRDLCRHPLSGDPRVDAMAVAGPHPAVGTSEARQPAPAAELPALRRAYAGEDQARPRRSPRRAALLVLRHGQMG